MTIGNEIAEAVRDAGYYLVSALIDSQRIAELRAILESLDTSGVRRRGEMYAVRNLFDASPAFRDLARDVRLRAAVEAVCGRDCFAIGATLLDKIPEANWKVPFHMKRSE